MTANDEAPAGPAAGALLEEMGALRRRARRTRQAYWFPLLVFGLVEAGSAPLYQLRLPPCGTGDVCTASRPALGTGPWRWAVDRTLYALLGTLAGVALTVWWYRRHARRVGVRTGTRGPVLAWTGASLGMLVVTALPIVFVWVLTIHDTTWLIPIAAGMLALAWAERSVLLGVVAVLHAVAAGLGVAYDPENLLYRVLSAFGVADQDMPFDYGPTVNVLLPGAVLLAGGLAAFLVNRRRPA
jgi:hypothetical protein